MSFLGVIALLRTHSSFRTRNDDVYHKEHLPIYTVKAVPIDYKHAVCLETMKR
jgi:hypothetical protein